MSVSVLRLSQQSLQRNKTSRKLGKIIDVDVAESQKAHDELQKLMEMKKKILFSSQ